MQEQITQLFQFQTTAMATPMATFGEVPATYPPGFIFDMGVWISEEQQLIPIRFLHFEQRRIVIDVAGPSTAITAIYTRLEHFLSELHASDGSRIMGEPEHVHDLSVITACFPFPMETLFASPLRKLFAKILGADVNGEESAVISTLVLQGHEAGRTIEKVSGPEDSFAFTLAPRAGTNPEERIYISSAPLDSEAHLSYLNELESALRF